MTTTPTMPTCGEQRPWMVSVCARRAVDAALVVSTSTDVYSIYHTGLGSPTCVTVQLPVPAGAWLRLAWIQQPYPESACVAVNALVSATATLGVGSATVPLASISRVSAEPTPGAASDWVAPSLLPSAFATAVMPGTVIEFSHIGTVPVSTPVLL